MFILKFFNTLVTTSRNCKIKTFCYSKSSSVYASHRSFSYKMKLNRKLFAEVQPWSYSKCACFHSALKCSVLSDLTQEIDTEAVKEKCRKHLLMTGNELHPKDLVQEELKMRIDQAIENFTEQEKRALKIIQLEHSFLFSQGYSISSPDKMTNEHWLQAMTLSTMEDRFYYYLEIEHMKVRQNPSVSTGDVEITSDDAIYEGSGSLFCNCDLPDLEVRWGNYRLASAMQFGIPLVIDMDFVHMNSPTELAPLTQQLWDMYCVNRAHPQPFHLIFTNCHDSNPIYRYLILHQMIKTSFILATFTEKSYTDLFPSEDLVYLSAQSPYSVGELTQNGVYIIGAYYDPLVVKKGSFARARQNKIRCLRLPISENVRWKHQASKDLDINHVVAILLSVKDKMSWKEALLANVPMLINQMSEGDTR